ncbi:oligosaccharide flippase family protein [Massilia forsythiae]|uniref:Oligosaccharide flippase family protein n=1 Tax=Massilia forsythiae TaxID=2728020 RepID=A0A7Z2ZQU9_9BURK|nr:oligosaccharide flippase family protein [Massilia forsythiae]QJD98782.1 oligosaccharide flippase family protein [Massilia forsythiae]
MNLSLFRNALANLLGAVVPAVVALGTVPLVVKGLGDAGYGLYSLVTAIVGYFAVLDINVTAGSVKYIAEFNARQDRERINQTVCFGLSVYAVLGLLGALGLACGAGFLVTRVFSVPAALQAEAVDTLRLAALGFFVGQLLSYLQSIPQSLMRYDIASRIEMLFGTGVPLLTVGVLLLGHGLFDVILLRVVASTVHAGVLWHSVRKLLPGLAWRRPGAAIRRELLGFSAYSFLSRFATLSYAYADKLIIGALAGVTALAYFTVASTLANRILGLTYRLSGVLFPAASALAARGELERLRRLYLKANRYIVFINASVLVLVAVFSYEILFYWMDARFARAGQVVLAVMTLSQFIDSLTSLPSLVNDGMGHPRYSGMFALVRAVLGLLVVYLGVAGWGIAGAAWGHLAASLLLTCAFLVAVHGRTVPATLGDLARQSYLPSVLGVGAVAIAAGFARQMAGGAPLALLALVLATAAALGVHGALCVLEPDDKAMLRTRLAGLVKGILSVRKSV